VFTTNNRAVSLLDRSRKVDLADEKPLQATLRQPYVLKEAAMKFSAILTAAAISSLLAMSASAEEYQGVLQFQSTASRADVRTQAVAAAHSADPYRDGASAGVALALASQLDRTSVRAQAVAAAHSADPYREGAFAGVAPALASQRDLATVRAEARANARGFTQAAL
jgi:hypothetical protein